MNTDEQLVQQAIHGGDAAFAELVERYRDKLYRFLVTRCASAADAEDATQDAFINAYRYLDSFNPKWRFSTWIYRIALREAGKARQVPTAEGEEPVASEDPLADCIEEGERRNLWMTARRVLSADTFTAMWLHYAEDMPMKDVARTMDRSLSWTKVNMLRARRKLQQEMLADDNVDHRSTSYG